MNAGRYDNSPLVGPHVAEAQRIRTEQRELDGVFEQILREAQEIVRLVPL